MTGISFLAHSQWDKKMEELLAISLALHADGREKITFVGRGVYRVGQDLLLELKTTDLPHSIVALSTLDQAKSPGWNTT